MNPRTERPKILFASRLPLEPSLGASAVVLYRHLTELAKVAEVRSLHSCLITRSSTPCSWQELYIKSRHTWWPPKRHWLPFSGRIRDELIRQKLRSLLKDWNPDLVICFPQDIDYDLARNLLVKVKSPLLSIIHDSVVDPDDNYHPVGKVFRLLLQASNHCFVVSNRQIGYSNKFGAKESSVLLPIPESISGIANRTYKEGMTLAVVGKIVGAYQTIRRFAEVLNDLGGKMLIVSSDSGIHNTQLPANVSIIPRFNTSSEAIRFIAENADAILVPYPLLEDSTTLSPMLKDSIPSRLIEFASARLPIVVATPASFAAADWANSLDIPTITQPTDIAIKTALERIFSREEWLIQQRRVDRLRETTFCPKRIHNTFIDRVFDLIDNENA